MGDHGEVVEWLELVCMCANVLCWFFFFEIAKLSLKIARVQMSNAPAVTKPRGSRMCSLVGSWHPLSLGVTFGSRPGVGSSNPVNTWFLEVCFLQQKGLQRR